MPLKRHWGRARIDRMNPERVKWCASLSLGREIWLRRFGNFTLSFDQPDKKHISFDGSYLRVWRKINGEWLEDAFFARPNEPEEKKKSDTGSNRCEQNRTKRYYR